MKSAASRWAYLMLASAALFWSGNFVLGRAFSSEIGPLTLGYWRWMLALLVFLPLAWRALVRDRAIIRANIGWLLFMGATGVAAFNTLVYLGLQHTQATNALLINSFIPILILIISRLMRTERLRAKQWLGVSVSTCGMLLLVLRGSLDNLLAFDFNRGDLWLLLAALDWAVYSIALRWRPPGLSANGFLLASMLVGVAILTPLYWVNTVSEPPMSLTVANLSVIGYVALFASLAAFLLWNQGVGEIGAATAGQFIHLMPLFGAVMAMLFLGERLYWFHVFGALAIGSGIYLTVRAKTKTA